MRSIRASRPSPALVVAIIALVVALGGTSLAAITVTGSMIRNNSVTSVDLADNAIVSRDIRNGSIFPVDLSAAAKRTLTGPAGPIGPAGPAGTNGTNGSNGAQGVQGPVGPSGVVAHAFASDSSSRALVSTVGTSGTLAEAVVLTLDRPGDLELLGTIEATDNGSADTTFLAQCVMSVFSVATSVESVVGDPITVRGPDDLILVSTIHASTAVAAGSYSVQLNCWDAAGSNAKIDRATLSATATAS